MHGDFGRTLATWNFGNVKRSTRKTLAARIAGAQSGVGAQGQLGG